MGERESPGERVRKWPNMCRNDERQRRVMGMYIPSGQAVLVLQTNSTSMLDIFVGFTSVRVRRPLRTAGGELGKFLFLPVGSALKKTTDSARRISNEFL